MNEMPRPPIDADEDELDPALEKVRVKMIRLLAVSIGIMVVGIFAVFIAIFWRLNQLDDATLTEADLIIPVGFRVQSVTSGSDTLTVFGSDSEGAQRVLTYDVEGGQALGNFRLTEASDAALPDE
ncbi:MAG: DUF6476 family protein [Pseudomonadota bacterium]